MEPEPTRAELLRVDPDYATASWGPVFILIWRVNTTVEGARDVRLTSHTFGDAHPKGAWLITIVESGAPMPSPSAREEIATYLREASRYLRASAVVYEGSGFRAAAVRGVVTGIAFLARQAYPHRVFATVTEAISWMVRELREPLGDWIRAEALLAAVNDVRQRIQQV